MSLASIQNCTWKLMDTDVYWPRRTNEAGTLQHRRQLGCTVETTADATSVALHSSYFINAETTISNFVAYVGNSQNSSTGAKPPPTPITLTGVWNIETIRVAYDRGEATIRMALWAYTSDWTDVPKSTL